MGDSGTGTRKGMLRRLSTFGTLQREEFQASINALNLFFGAIIGVNFSDMQDLPPKDYAVVLFLTASLIALILIVSNTRRRVWSAFQLLLALAGYYYLFRIDPMIEGISDNLMVTLGVWAACALIYEFGTPVEKDERGD